MKEDNWNIPYRSAPRVLLLSFTLLVLTHDLPIIVIAQTLPATSTSGLAYGASSSVTASFALASHAPSMTISSKPFVASNTTSALTSSTNTAVPSDVLPGSSHPSQGSSESLFHYYWLILALFGVFVAFFLYWINRRRRRRKEQVRVSGQNALARDMEGWVNTRRWFPGNRRPYQTRDFLRREEGLNEQGEAPPPYQPKDDVTVTEREPQDQVVGLPIPLRTLSREEVGAGHPPGYREATGHEQVVATGSGPADLHTMVPNASHSSDSAHVSSVNNISSV